MCSCKSLEKDRLAFHVDKHLKESAKKAARAFEQEEDDLKEAILWRNSGTSGY